MGSAYAEDGSLEYASALPLPATAQVEVSLHGQLPVKLPAQQVVQPQPGLGGRQLYSKEQWEAQKPVIRLLYNVQNKPYNRVIDILWTEHNFFPTYATPIISYGRIEQLRVTIY
jgi:Clr5 domain